MKSVRLGGEGSDEARAAGSERVWSGASRWKTESEIVGRLTFLRPTVSVFAPHGGESETGQRAVAAVINRANIIRGNTVKRTAPQKKQHVGSKTLA